MAEAWPEDLAGTSEFLNDLANRAGVRFFDYQWDCFLRAADQLGPSQRLCLYYRTGAGKTITGLVNVALWGHSACLVVAPPSTHRQWWEWGGRLGVDVETMSHAKFRMKDTKLSRTKPIIVDEFHLLGGHKGQGWKKLDRLAASLQAPLVIMSATPNYNDAERVYCIQHVLDPLSCRGGYLEFLYRECNTRQNPFGQEPLVDEDQPFRRFKDAAEYLASLPNVEYLPDELVWSITDIPVPSMWPAEAETFGLNTRSSRIIASQMEERHARINLALVDECGMVRDHIYDILTNLADAATTPILVFAAHATVADALGATLHSNRVKHAVVTGSTPAKKKAAYLDAFRAGVLDVLVGTATLATGTDGMDKMCDTLIILDDTDDDSLRRQLVGRIMPRGADADASTKQVYRLVVQ